MNRSKSELTHCGFAIIFSVNSTAQVTGAASRSCIAPSATISIGRPIAASSSAGLPHSSPAQHLLVVEVALCPCGRDQHRCRVTHTDICRHVTLSSEALDAVSPTAQGGRLLENGAAREDLPATLILHRHDVRCKTNPIRSIFAARVRQRQQRGSTSSFAMTRWILALVVACAVAEPQRRAHDI